MENNKTLALAILITGFLMSNAYGEDNFFPNDREWEKKAKSLGIPLVPVGTVVLCESEEAVGFNWENGEYVSTVFKPEKRIYVKLEKNKCSKAINKKSNFLIGMRASTSACYGHFNFGDKPSSNGHICDEVYNGKSEPKVHCSILSDEINFSINGLFHYSNNHNNLSSNPKDGYKDSLTIEWGRCAPVSPKY